jgi:mono/diheme cytochrome c family protein
MPRTILTGSILLGALLSCFPGPAYPQRDVKEPIGEAPLIDSINGRPLFKSYCASCHGTDARGGGPVAKSLKVPPPDLTSIAARNGGTFPLARVSRIISGDDGLPGGHGSREMPVWGPVFSRVESDRDLGRVRIDNLARYLREIQKP